MNEDMSEIFKKMNEMLKNDEVPDSVKSLLNSLNSNANDIQKNFLGKEQLQRIQSKIFQILI